MAKDHSIVDSNFKPSNILIDFSTNNPFAWQGDHALGVGYVQIVDNSGTPIVSFSGSTQYTDAGTPPAHPVGGTLEWNNAGVWATVGSAAPLPISLPSATITTLTPPSNTGYALDASLTTLDTDIKANITLHAGTNLIGKVGIDQTTPGTTNLVALGANQSVNLAQVAGTNTVTGGVAGSQSVGGTVATNVAITANPLNLGAQAVSSENAAVTTGRQVQLVADLAGKQIVLPYANPENFISGRASATDTTSTSLLAAPATGLRNYITQITVWNSSAVSTYIKIQDGSGGTELYDIPAPAGGGATLTLPVPLRQPTTATALFFAANASANAIVISASGYKGI